MALLSVIRRWHFREQLSIRAIARRTGLSRNTIRKILRTDATSFSYERERQPKPKVGPWQGQLDALLDGNHGKPERERLTLIRIYEELRGLGYQGSYDAIRRYARSWLKARGWATAGRPMCRCCSRLARPTSSTGATRSCCSTA